MSSYATEPIIRKTLRKPKRCFWCGEWIEGEHVEWTWFESGDADVVKVHRECQKAWNTLPLDDAEIMAYGFSRGCTCQSGQCECKEKARAE